MPLTDPEFHATVTRAARRRLSDGDPTLLHDRRRQRDARDRRLRALLGAAKANSPWHRDRLAAVDVASFTVDDLTTIPTMSKQDVMTHWDDVVCDPRLTRRAAEQHLDDVAYGGKPPLLDGRYVVVTSGGSSGKLGVFAWDIDDLFSHAAACGRFHRWLSDHASHGDGPHAAIWSGRERFGAMLAEMSGIHSRPAWTPLDELLSWLNGLRPDCLGGYAGVLAMLADAAAAEALAIEPRLVRSTGEPLSAAFRQKIAAAWGSAVVVDEYRLTEAPGIACSYPGQTELSLAEDAAVIEVVDADNGPVPVGAPGHRILLTVLGNRTLPLIRYEVDDTLAALPDGAIRRSWAGPLFSPPRGRSDEILRWPDGAAVHPLPIRSALTNRNVLEYQVRQLPDGVQASVVTTGVEVVAALREDLTRILQAGGVTSPTVEIDVTDALPHLASGKVRRFVPLETD